MPKLDVVDHGHLPHRHTNAQSPRISCVTFHTLQLPNLTLQQNICKLTETLKIVALLLNQLVDTPKCEILHKQQTVGLSHVSFSAIWI